MLEGPTAANNAEDRKRRKYEKLSQEHLFQPIAFEHLGGMGESTQKFMKQLGNLIASVTGEQRSGFFLRQKLSIAIQKVVFHFQKS